MITSCLDTGCCAPESTATLLLQQKQLEAGRRHVQMFPLNTPELPLPEGMRRFENFRGVFHFNPAKITAGEIEQLSLQGRENEYLNLGPYSKYEVVLRHVRGEHLICITEFSRDGVEIRSAIGTGGTIRQQEAYFDSTKEVGSLITVGPLPDRVAAQLMRG